MRHISRQTTYPTVILSEREEGIALCIFNRPDVRNALNLQMVYDIRQVLEQVRGNASCRVLVFVGAGDQAFVSGADIAELKERRRDDAFKRINTALFREIEQLPQPTIAAVRGYCLGGGMELAMACDLRVAGRTARFGQPEVGLGILPGAGGTYRLPRLVGLGRAKELVFSGRLLNADEALAWGLVNQVVESEAALDAALSLARDIAGKSALAVRLAKTGLNASAEMSIDAAMAWESTAQAVLFEDEEKEQRMAAFLERRKKN
jgi:enoyl-CoA hydratase